MNIKDRINMIKSKKQQIEALLSAKEKEVEEEYQMVMELYNEAKNYSERVEAIKAKQKQTEETLDKYDSILNFLNDDLPTEEEPTMKGVNEPVKEGDIVVVEEEPPKKSDSSVTKKKWNIDTKKEEPSKEEIDKMFVAAGFGEEVKEPVKQEYVDETLTQEDRDKAKQEEIDELLKMI